MGDALGMPYEGASPDMIPAPLDMRDARLGRGTYTDDTQMMVALAESLLQCGEIDDRHLANTFLLHYDPRRGYGAGTVEVFGRWEAGESTVSAAGRLFGGQGSLGNGAAMRIAPVAVAFARDPERLAEQGRRSARLTHRHPLGIEAAVAQAAAVAAALRGEDLLDAAHTAAHSEALRSRFEQAAQLRSNQPSPGEVARVLGNSSAANESVPAAVFAASACSSFEEAVTFAVGCGGDADTIGAMCGAAAGARLGASAIPTRWLDALEDSADGRSHVERLCVQLDRFACTVATTS